MLHQDHGLHLYNVGANRGYVQPVGGSFLRFMASFPRGLERKNSWEGLVESVDSIPVQINAWIGGQTCSSKARPPRRVAVRFARLKIVHGKPVDVLRRRG